jgi:adenylosuccinate synthase
VISGFDKEAEAAWDLVHKIGSTGSGTGAALVRRMQRDSKGPPVLARDHPNLAPFLRPTLPFLNEVLRANESVVIEGTQGFGLSLLHGGHWPKSTSRDTTAAAFVAETGVSMRAVDDIVLVLRTYPIRVGGDSGPMPHEIDWPTLAREAGLPSDYCELATATKRVRRVARFDSALPARAVASNGPHRIVLNHLDYVDSKTRDGILTQCAGEFIRMVESGIGQKIDLVGTGPGTLLGCSELRAAA